MTPLLPFSIWKHNQYGILMVLDSSVMADKKWEIYFQMRNDDIALIECEPMEWILNASFLCERNDLQRYDEEDEE
jgi:hypothetical protein